MNKTQARQIALGLSFLLLLIIGLTIWLANQYGLGSKERELSVLEAEQLFKTLFTLDSYDDYSIVNSYEYIDKYHENRYIHLVILFSGNPDLPIHLNLTSQPINFEVIKAAFYGSSTPEWWQPDNVRRGFYYSGEYRSLKCNLLIDSENKLYYLVAQMNVKEKL